MLICTNCGVSLTSKDKFCPTCGYGKENKMRMKRKSWHYRWQAYWFRQFGWANIIEWRVTKREYMEDIIIFTVFLPFALLWLVGRNLFAPRTKSRPANYIEFIGLDNKETE